jgi:membrane protein
MQGLIRRVIAWALSLKIVRAFLHYSEHRGPMLADSITYRTLFSVFAGVLLGFSIAGFWLAGNPDARRALVDAVDAAVPGLVGHGGVIDVSAITAPAGLTVAGILSLVGLVGAAIGAIGSLRTALRMLADRVGDDLFFLWVVLRNLGLAIGIGAALAVSAGVSMLATAGIGLVTAWLGLGADDPFAVVVARIVSVLGVFVLDGLVVAVSFRLLSGMKPPAPALWTGALIGAVGLTVLQELSGLFIGGAKSNPLLASFASLIALLLWFNLSAQVILIASAYIVVATEESQDRVRIRYGATTFAQRRLQQAEDAVRLATGELERARAAEAKERADA